MVTNNAALNVDYTIITFNDNTSTPSTSTLWYSDTHYCNGWCTHGTYYWYPSYPQTIYKYQVKCPKCKKTNWLELEKITPCTKCSSTLKAVSKSVDYEVEIDD